MEGCCCERAGFEQVLARFARRWRFSREPGDLARKEVCIAVGLLSARSCLPKARRLNAFQSRRPALGNGGTTPRSEKIAATANLRRAGPGVTAWCPACRLRPVTCHGPSDLADLTTVHLNLMPTPGRRAAVGA